MKRSDWDLVNKMHFDLERRLAKLEEAQARPAPVAPCDHCYCRVVRVADFPSYGAVDPEATSYSPVFFNTSTSYSFGPIWTPGPVEHFTCCKCGDKKAER